MSMPVMTIRRDHRETRRAPDAVESSRAGAPAYLTVDARPWIGPLARVTALVGLHGVLVGRIRSWLRQRGEPVVVAGLHGSAARRDGGSESDVDLVVVVENGEADELADELADIVERWSGNRGHVQCPTIEEHARLVDGAFPLVASWQHDLQPIIGTRRQLLGAEAMA